MYMGYFSIKKLINIFASNFYTGRRLEPLRMNKKLKDKIFLIVEDDLVSQELLKEIFTVFNVGLILTNSEEEAVKTFTLTPGISLVLMDIRLPGQDGYETTKILKSIYPAIPVIAQTAYALEGDREKALKAGCDDFISKPVKPSVLKEKILRFF